MALGLTPNTSVATIAHWNCACCFNLLIGSVQGFAAVVNPSYGRGIDNFFRYSAYTGDIISGINQYWTLSGYSGELFLMTFSQDQNAITGSANILLGVPRQQDATTASNWFTQNHPRTGYLKIKLSQQNNSSVVEFFSSADNGATWTKRNFDKYGDYLTASFSTALYGDTEATAVEVRLHLVLPRESMLMPFNVNSPHSLDTTYFTNVDSAECFSGSWDNVYASLTDHAVSLTCQGRTYSHVTTYLLKHFWSSYAYFLIFPQLGAYHSGSPNVPYEFSPDFREPVFQSWDGAAFAYHCATVGAYFENANYFPALPGDLTITL